MDISSYNKTIPNPPHQTDSPVSKPEEREDTMNDKLNGLKRGFYGRLEDLTEELEEMGCEVVEANDEYVAVQHEDGEDTVETILYICVTGRTITVDEIREYDRIH